jgi:hypothetical protein
VQGAAPAADGLLSPGPGGARRPLQRRRGDPAAAARAARRWPAAQPRRGFGRAAGVAPRGATRAAALLAGRRRSAPGGAARKR